MNTRVLVYGILGAAAAGFAAYGWSHAQPPRPQIETGSCHCNTQGPKPPDALQPPIREGRAQAGDAAHGRELYLRHCASCHGAEGKGNGPATAYLLPPPRDHTDPGYMNTRTDEELHRVIAEGGKALELSPLMPRWDDRVGPLDAWDLVAYLRTLHPLIGDLWPGARAVRFHDAVLDDAAAATARETTGSGLSTEERAVAWFELAAPEGTAADAAFGTSKIGNNDVVCGAAVGADGRLLRAAFFQGGTALPPAPPLVDGIEKLSGRTGAEIARAMAAEPQPGRKAALWLLARTMARLEQARSQRERDLSEALALKETLKTRPDSLPSAQRRYLENCAACHGATGSGVEIAPGTHRFRPRNLTQGAVLNRMGDQYLSDVIRRGGIPMNLSGAMPAYGEAFTAEQIREQVLFLRGLARPQSDDLCCCGGHHHPGCAAANGSGPCACKRLNPPVASCPAPEAPAKPKENR